MAITATHTLQSSQCHQQHRGSNIRGHSTESPTADSRAQGHPHGTEHALGHIYIIIQEYYSRRETGRNHLVPSPHAEGAVRVTVVREA